MVNGTTENVDEISPGDTAWMMTSTVLVLFMTLPGLILYYSGMVRVQNVLATAMQIFSITCLISALWMFFGYSLAFGPAHGNTSSPIYGDGSRLWLLGMHPYSTHQNAPNIPESLFCAFQMTFAIIAPSLIVGSFADRMKYIPMLIFMALWHLLVYCPIAHSLWHPDGFLFKAGALDYAGGTVVHISSGMSGLMSILVIGNRQGFGDENKKYLTAPHNILFTVMGTCMLWIGWFGFNAGSAVSAGVLATNAFLNTFLSSSFGAISWLLTEWYFRRKPSVLGMVNGAVAGLVTITPACGYVNPTASFFIGTIGGIVCYFGSQLKYRLRIDDALDAFGVHAVGGIVGGILTGFFSNQNINGADGVFYAPLDVGFTQVGKQIYGIVAVGLWACIASLIILIFLNKTMGLRVKPEVEINGLDKKFFREEINLYHQQADPTTSHQSHGNGLHSHHILGEIAMNVLHLSHFDITSPFGSNSSFSATTTSSASGTTGSSTTTFHHSPQSIPTSPPPLLPPLSQEEESHQPLHTTHSDYDNLI